MTFTIEFLEYFPSLRQVESFIFEYGDAEYTGEVPGKGFEVTCGEEFECANIDLAKKYVSENFADLEEFACVCKDTGESFSNLDL